MWGGGTKVLKAGAEGRAGLGMWPVMDERS